MKNLSKALSQLLLGVLLISTISCHENTRVKSNTKDSFYTIPFAEIIKNKRTVNLSEIASDVEIIQLDNTQDALLGNIENIEFTNDYIFVQCWNQPVLQFSRTGTYIRPIGAIGKGPGEYNNCIKMSLDEQDKKVYIHTWQHTMMVFNFDGKYLKTIQFKALESFMNFWSWGRDSMLVSYFEPVQGNEPYVFIEYNEQGDTLQGVSNYIFFDKNEQADPVRFFVAPERNFAYRFNNKLHMKGCYNDTVYTYNESNKIVPEYAINLGKHKLPNDLILERKWKRALPDGLIWTGVHETSDYVFIPYAYYFDEFKPETEKKKKGLVIYNKQSKEGMAVNETIKGGINDDLTGGPIFRPIAANDHTAIMLVLAMDLKQYLDSDEFKNSTPKYPEKKKRLEQLANSLNENDNPVLMLVKLKE